MSLSEVLALHLGALFIGISKAGFGGGTGVLTTPLFALVMSGREAIGVMLPLLIATDIMALSYYRGQVSKANVLTLVPGMLIGIALATPVLGVLPDVYFKKTIGVLALLFALAQVYKDFWLKKETVFRPRPWHGVLLGIGAGFVSTLAHIGGILTTMYLLPQRLSNPVFVGTATVIYFIGNFTKLLPYLRLHLITESTLHLDLWLLPSIALGAVLGFILNRKIPSRTFSHIVLLLVAVMAVRLLWD